MKHASCHVSSQCELLSRANDIPRLARSLPSQYKSKVNECVFHCHYSHSTLCANMQLDFVLSHEINETGFISQDSLWTRFPGKFSCWLFIRQLDTTTWFALACYFCNEKRFCLIVGLSLSLITVLALGSVVGMMGNLFIIFTVLKCRVSPQWHKEWFCRDTFIHVFCFVLCFRNYTVCVTYLWWTWRVQICVYRALLRRWILSVSE